MWKSGDCGRVPHVLAWSVETPTNRFASEEATGTGRKCGWLGPDRRRLARVSVGFAHRLSIGQLAPVLHTAHENIPVAKGHRDVISTDWLIQV